MLLLKSTAILTLVILLNVEPSCSYHVLVFHNFGTTSHLIMMTPLIRELLDRGHKVTALIFGTVNIKHENFTEMFVPNYVEKIMEKQGDILIKKQNIFHPKNLFTFYKLWKDIKEDVAHGILQEDSVKELVETSPKIDALITIIPFGSVFADYFDCPLILFSPGGPYPFMMTGTGNDINLSIQPYVSAPFIEPMTFRDRIFNYLLDQGYQFFFHSIEDTINQHIEDGRGLAYTTTRNETLRRPISRIRDILHNRMSVIISCSHYITHGPWPYLPNVIEVGGLQLGRRNALTEDFQKFMDSYPNVLYVSFGSSLKPDQMPKEMFIEAFKALPEMGIIWKWDSEILDLPRNVKISPWLPQQEILSHPNLKVFVTHGGMGSLVEAIFHKAPIVGIPFSNDQKPNLLRAVKNGYAKMLNWDNINVEDFTSAIKSAIQDDDMKNAMETVNSLYVDRDVTPREKAAWWVEYVCKHRGAKWLKPEVEVPWWLYHHIDILGLFLLLTLAVIFFLVVCFKCIFRCCCRKKVKVD